MNACLLNAGHMVYRRLSPVGDDRRRGQGAPVAIWHGSFEADCQVQLRTSAMRPRWAASSASRPPLAVEPLAGRSAALGLCLGAAGNNEWPCSVGGVE